MSTLGSPEGSPPRPSRGRRTRCRTGRSCRPPKWPILDRRSRRGWPRLGAAPVPAVPVAALPRDGRGHLPGRGRLLCRRSRRRSRPRGPRRRPSCPSDGAVQYTESKTRTDGRSTAGVPFVTESARFTGADGRDQRGLHVRHRSCWPVWTSRRSTGIPFWRTTTTEIGQPTSSQQLVRVYRVGGAVELVGESGPGLAHVYQPALVELPADVAPGQHLDRLGLGR